MNVTTIQKGFTLVELVIVIVISGILAIGSVQFVGQATQGYSDAADRQQLATIGWIASEKITRELRNALPNSLRVSASTSSGVADTCLEFVPIIGGSHYKTLPNTVTPRVVTAIASGLTSAPATARIAVYPTEVGDVYTQPNPGPISDTAIASLSKVGSIDTITLGGDFEFASESPERRFYITQDPITYCIDGARLNRYSGYGFSSSKGSPQIIVDKIQRGTFSVTPPTLRRNAVVAMHFELMNGTPHVVDQEVQIRNVP